MVRISAGRVVVVAWLHGCAGTGVGGDGGESGSSGSSSGAADPTGAPTTATTANASASATEASSDALDSSSSAGSTESTSVAVDSTGTTGEPFPDPIPDDCITDVTAGHHTFECDGLVYDLEVPEACLVGPCGMVFDVHGLAMSAQMQDASTHLRALGQEFGYIVVQPNADPPPPLANWIPEIDDDKVFDAMQRVAAAFHVDADRWHFTGFSQGGFMTWRFACAHADVLASVAPGAACGNDFPIADCQFTEDESPTEPIDILYMHGTADLVVNFACALPRRDAVIERFGLGEGEALLDDPDVRRTRYASDAMVLEYVEHDYTGDSILAGGHCMPGADDPGDAPGQAVPASCDDPLVFVWGAEVMAFFVAHPRGA